MLRSQNVLNFLLLGLAAILYSCSPQNTTAPVSAPTATLVTETSEPEFTQQSYNWRGTTLTLMHPLPGSPTEAGVFLAQPEAHATIEDARALASRLGMQGLVYEGLIEFANTPDFLIVDGNQRLNVRSDGYFAYFPNFPQANYGVKIFTQAEAEASIAEFMQSLGFDFQYKVEQYSSDGYYALPLMEGGLPLRHEYFRANGLWFIFNNDGIASVFASLIEGEHIADYGIITAEEALQKLLAPSAAYGILEGGHSVSAIPQEWVRVRPKDQTVTVYGWMNSVKPLDGDEPLVTLDGYTVTGNVREIAESLPITFVEATGQFRSEDGSDVFVLESWRVYGGFGEGWVGTLHREGEQILLTTEEGQTLTMPDVPADVPLPLENVYAMGVTHGETFEWTSFDMRVLQMGGGGGGGGLGFYTLNLSGTPAPLPTDEVETEAESTPETSPSAPTAMIESVELVYFIPDPRNVSEPSTDPAYIQPVWRFFGHLSTGDVFEILVQALQPEFLSREIQVIEGPG